MSRKQTDSRQKVPEFAVVGHPNEGKSSVLSTLAEDDSVRISPVPGETRECRRFPVRVDGRELIAFIDTPGFQNPRRTLEWIERHQAAPDKMLADFIRTHSHDQAFHDDCQLLGPLSRGAGIIFVVDGSRPVRNMDRAEMEILRLTGLPRMAILNCKEGDTRFLEQWRLEFSKHFNSVRLFNATRATYAERIALLESLRAIDQDNEDALRTVIQAFEQDWRRRSENTVELILNLLEQTLSYRRSAPIRESDDEERLRVEMGRKFDRFVRKREQQTHARIRALFKHNIFSPELPRDSLLAEDLFSEKTWQFLGLSKKQLVVTGFITGATLAAGVDLAAGGASLGIFSALGGLAGAAATAWRGGELLSRIRPLGIRLDEQRLSIGPVKSPQLMFILLDRSLLFYQLVSNWAHGRRDHDLKNDPDPGNKRGMTTTWKRNELQLCERFFRQVTTGDGEEQNETRAAMRELLLAKLDQLSRADLP
jgi:hypothetical protein